MFLRRREFIRLSGKKIELIPLNAKRGLELIHEFAVVIETTAPYVALLSEPSRIARGMIVAKLLKEVQGIDRFVFKTVSIATGIEQDRIENEMSLKELVNAFVKILRQNDLQKFWKAAYSLKIVEEKKYFSWMYSMVNKRIKADV